MKRHAMRYGVGMKLLHVLALFLFIASPAHAANEDARLQSLESTLKEEQKEQQDLARKLSSAKTDMETTQSGLVKLARSIQANEKKMSELDARIAELTPREADLTARLQKDYGSISNLILALQRIRRIPPEAVIAKPGAPLQTAQSALILQSILPGVNARASALAADLEKLGQIRQSLAEDREKLAQAGETLKAQSDELQTLLGKRKSLFKATRNDYETKQKDVAKISGEAQSLRDLIARLEQQDREAARTLEGKKTARAMPKTGIPGLPVSGPVITAFGEKDAIGAISQGVTVRAKPGGLVVAPMGGIIKFAGAFRNYGQLIVIQHENNYHSLVGGLGRISVALGQSVQSGEPLGNMPSGASSGNGVTLYYELRQKGRPVDPATKLKDLRS